MKNMRSQDPPRATILFLAALLLAAASGAPSQSRLEGASGTSTKTPSQECFEELVKRATHAKSSGDAEQAITLYSKALEIQPDDLEDLRQLASLLTQYQNYARAEGVLHNLLSLEPKNGLAWAQLGICEYELGDYMPALRHFRYSRVLMGPRNLDLGSTDLEKMLTTRTALLLENEASYQAALQMIRDGMAIDAYSILMRGASLDADTPRLKLAFGLAALHLAVQPENLDAQQKDLVTRLGAIADKSATVPVSESVAAYQTLLSEQPNTPGLHFAFGLFYLIRADFDRALDQMKKELELSPRDSQAFAMAAMACEGSGKYEAALSYAAQAEKVTPDLFYGPIIRGRVLSELDRSQEAIPELERAVKLDPGSPPAHYLLSRAYARAGRNQESRKEIEIFTYLRQNTPPPEWAPRPRRTIADARGCIDSRAPL